MGGENFIILTSTVLADHNTVALMLQ